MRAATCLAILLCACAAGVDRSQPPRLANGAGGFTVRRLSEPPVIDGRTWIEVRDQIKSAFLIPDP